MQTLSLTVPDQPEIGSTVTDKDGIELTRTEEHGWVNGVVSYGSWLSVLVHRGPVIHNGEVIALNVPAEPRGAVLDSNDVIWRRGSFAWTSGDSLPLGFPFLLAQSGTVRVLGEAQ